MASSFDRGNGGGLMTEINVTPLVDVVLVILVLMMVTATAIASRTIGVDLPQARTASSSTTPEPLVVTIDPSGRLFFGADLADEALVRARAREAAANGATVMVAADGRTRHEAVVFALDVLRSERVTKIAIVVRPESSAR